MSDAVVRNRYDASQLVEALGRAGREGTLYIVASLGGLPDPQARESALVAALEHKLPAEARRLVLVSLAALRRAPYLKMLINEGLRSPSINAQQLTMLELSRLVGDGLEPGLAMDVESWLRRRLKNPRRANTWASFEPAGAGLSLLPSYGAARVLALLEEVGPRMQPEEQPWLVRLRGVVEDDGEFEKILHEWCSERVLGYHDDHVPDTRDPTADVSVDRAMKRLGYRPANPDSEVWDPLADFDDHVRMFEIDLGSPPDSWPAP